MSKDTDFLALWRKQAIATLQAMAVRATITGEACGSLRRGSPTQYALALLQIGREYDAAASCFTGNGGEHGWDPISKLACALGMTPPPDDDGFWSAPNGDLIHCDDLPHELPRMVSEVMEKLLNDRVAPTGPLTVPT